MEKINWSELGFGYIKTDYNVRCYYRDGKWGELEVSSSEILNIHMAATCLHYGQESFEGLKTLLGAAFDYSQWTCKNTNLSGIDLLFSANFAVVCFAFLFFLLHF